MITPDYNASQLMGDLVAYFLSKRWKVEFRHFEDQRQNSFYPTVSIPAKPAEKTSTYLVYLDLEGWDHWDKVSLISVSWPKPDEIAAFLPDLARVVESNPATKLSHDRNALTIAPAKSYKSRLDDLTSMVDELVCSAELVDIALSAAHKAMADTANQDQVVIST